MCQIVEEYAQKRAMEERKEERRQLALKLIAKGYAFAEIVELTDLTLEEVKDLAESKTA